MLDSLTGDVDNIRWRLLPVTVAQSLASLWSGAVLGPEGAIGNISSRLAAAYCDLFRIPKAERGKLVFASVAAGYNGLLENPIFAAVLGTEVGGDAAERPGPRCRRTSSAAVWGTACSWCCTTAVSSTSCTCPP